MLDQKEAAVLNVLRAAKGWRSGPEIARRAGVNPVRIYIILGRLQDVGLVVSQYEFTGRRLTRPVYKVRETEIEPA